MENIKNVKEEIESKIIEAQVEIDRSDVDNQWNSLHSIIEDIQQNTIGLKSVGRGRKKKTGWWTDDMAQMVKMKNEVFKNWLKNRTPESRRLYEEQRKRTNQLKRTHTKKRMWEGI